jgi:hypothetical protein
MNWKINIASLFPVSTPFLILFLYDFFSHSVHGSHDQIQLWIYPSDCKSLYDFQLSEMTNFLENKFLNDTNVLVFLAFTTINIFWSLNIAKTQICKNHNT